MLKIRISIGLVERIKVNTQEICGGAVVKLKRRLLAVNLDYIKKRTKNLTQLQAPLSKSKQLNVTVVNKQVMKQINVQMIRICTQQPDFNLKTK